MLNIASMGYGSQDEEWIINISELIVTFDSSSSSSNSF